MTTIRIIMPVSREEEGSGVAETFCTVGAETFCILGLDPNGLLLGLGVSLLGEGVARTSGGLTLLAFVPFIKRSKYSCDSGSRICKSGFGQE